jgi:hypothetical protein
MLGWVVTLSLAGAAEPPADDGGIEAPTLTWRVEDSARFRLLEPPLRPELTMPSRPSMPTGWSPLYMLGEGAFGTWRLLGMANECRDCSDVSDGGLAIAWQIRGTPLSLFAGGIVSSGRAASRSLGMTFTAGMHMLLPNLLDVVQRRGRYRASFSNRPR